MVALVAMATPIFQLFLYIYAIIILNFFFHSDGQDIESQQRWYYDSSDGTCKEFDYLGKKGNGNRFLTRQDCQASCQPSQVERES